ncbi:hypothetical protein BH09PLA1_BH09PLA1_33890 [soil metagenome]
MRHGFQVAPPDSVASQHAVDAAPGEDVPWWTPSAGEIARHLGWRWIYVVPAGAALVALFLLPQRPGYLQFAIGLWKPLIIIVALPTAAAMRSIKTIVQHRKDPFCIHCGYTLLGLPDGHRCPECGRQFSLATIEEYRRDPHWFARRWKLMQTARPIADIAFNAGAVRRKKSRDGT